MRVLFVLLFALTSMIATAANASVYTVDFDFQPGGDVTGSITTSCDNCFLYPTNITAWSFALDGALAFSSSSNATALIYTNLGVGQPSSNSPLSALGGVISFTPSNEPNGLIGFCSDTACDTSLVFVAEALNYVQYDETVANQGTAVASSIFDLTTPYAIACDEAVMTCNAAMLPGVPEPSTWAMLLIGFAAIAGLGRLFEPRRVVVI